MAIAYREPPFSRVWVSTDPAKPYYTKYGLDKNGRTVMGEVHWDIPNEGREFCLRELADVVMNEERFIAQMRAERFGPDPVVPS